MALCPSSPASDFPPAPALGRTTQVPSSRTAATLDALPRKSTFLSAGRHQALDWAHVDVVSVGSLQRTLAVSPVFCHVALEAGRLTLVTVS